MDVKNKESWRKEVGEKKKGKKKIRVTPNLGSKKLAFRKRKCAVWKKELVMVIRL